jgi:hypothetical protein
MRREVPGGMKDALGKTSARSRNQTLGRFPQRSGGFDSSYWRMTWVVGEISRSKSLPVALDGHLSNVPSSRWRIPLVSPRSVPWSVTRGSYRRQSRASLLREALLQFLFRGYILRIGGLTFGPPDSFPALKGELVGGISIHFLSRGKRMGESLRGTRLYFCR